MQGECISENSKGVSESIGRDRRNIPLAPGEEETWSSSEKLKIQKEFHYLRVTNNARDNDLLLLMITQTTNR